jgi:hypothetical protein
MGFLGKKPVRPEQVDRLVKALRDESSQIMDGSDSDTRKATAVRKSAQRNSSKAEVRQAIARHIHEDLS